MRRAIVGDALDRVTKGVSEVEHLARAAFEPVVTDDHRLDAHRVGDDRLPRPLSQRVRSERLKRLERLASLDDSVLDELRKSFADVTLGERGERRDVAE